MQVNGDETGVDIIDTLGGKQDDLHREAFDRCHDGARQSAPFALKQSEVSV